MGSGSLSLHGALLDYGSHALRLNKGPLSFCLPLLAPAVRDGGDSPAPRMAMSSPMDMLQVTTRPVVVPFQWHQLSCSLCLSSGFVFVSWVSGYLLAQEYNGCHPNVGCAMCLLNPDFSFQVNMWRLTDSICGDLHPMGF